MNNSKKYLLILLCLVIVWLVGTFIYDRFSERENAINPIICLREGQAAENASLGPNGHFGKCCPGLVAMPKPGEEDVVGGAGYCTKVK